METVKPNNKKEKQYYQKEKELFLHYFKDRDDIFLIRKNQNNYINKLKSSINSGLTLLNETEIIRERYELKKKKKNIQLKNNFTNSTYNNSKNNIMSSSKEIKAFPKNSINQKSIPTSPNTNKKIKNFFTLNDAIRKKLFILDYKKSKRIKSSYTNQDDSKKVNNFVNNSTMSKDLIIPCYYNTKRITMDSAYNIQSYNNKNNKSIIKNVNSNRTLKSHRVLSANKTLKPFHPSFPDGGKEKHHIFNKAKIERKIKNTFNNTILKFDKKKFKFFSHKKIRKNIQKLSENKNSIKIKESMKKYYDVKKIFDNCVKKKKKSISDLKNNSLSCRRILNKKKSDFKNTVRRYFSGPNREIKKEFSKYIKNRYFIIDGDNNPYKFRIFNFTHNL